MELAKKELSRRIDEIIVSCAIGMGCDKAELMRLASEYGNVSDSYTFSKLRLAFEFEHEKKIALLLQEEVNDHIRRFRSAVGSHGRILQTRQFYSELGSHGKNLKNRKPKASPKASPNASPKASPKKTLRCNVLGGKRRTRINSKRRRAWLA
jgi:hypothetical protein